MNFEAVIGLEIHVETKTKTKMFSSAPNVSLKEPNTAVTYLDMAFPGTLPTVNKEAVKNAIKVSHALHMEIDRELHFDRKNYFYSDLPKGYQITQQRRPIGSHGYLDLRTSRGLRRIGIERLHMEEDTCKQLHLSDYTLLDYNRAGVPLVEIVSYPELRTGEEARLYVEAIRNIVVYSGVSDGKMEEGSLRCDVNISLRPYGQEEFGTKVEIKNLNSLKNIEEAIEYEKKRQASLLLLGQEIAQETRRYDESKGETVLMRVKTDAVDYKYYPEANIPPIRLSEDFVKKAIEETPELYDAKLDRYVKMGIGEKEARIILLDPLFASYFEGALVKEATPKEVASFLIVEINSYLNKKNLTISQLPLKSEAFGHIVAYGPKHGLTHQQTTKSLEQCLNSGISPEEAQSKLKIVALSSDEGEVKALVEEILRENPESVEAYRNGKDRALGFLVGQAMKKSHGKVNPALVSKLLQEGMK